MTTVHALHQRPVPAGRRRTRICGGPGRRRQHHPDQHRRGPRGGPGAARAGRRAGRRRGAGAGGGRVAHRPDGAARTARSPRRRSTRPSPAAAGPLAGVLRYSTAPIVSRDVIGDPASCVFDSALTQVHGRLVKVFGWYDNEWGYTNRLLDLTEYVGARL